MIVYSTWMTSFSSVQYTYCISSASERKETWNYMHFLVILSLKTLWAGVKHFEEQLCIVFMYTGNLYYLHDLATQALVSFKKYMPPPLQVSRNLKVIKKMCTFEVHLCMMSGQPILSGKPFNTFSMARFKNIAIASDPHSPFHYHQGSYYINPCYHAWHAFFFSLTIFS